MFRTPLAHGKRSLKTASLARLSWQQSQIISKPLGLPLKWLRTTLIKSVSDLGREKQESLMRSWKRFKSQLPRASTKTVKKNFDVSDMNLWKKVNCEAIKRF